MLAFCNRRQKKNPRDCADQLTKSLSKILSFLNDGFKTIVKENLNFLKTRQILHIQASEFKKIS